MIEQRGLRLWPAWLIFIVAVGVLVWVWWSDDLPVAMSKPTLTLMTAMVTLLLLGALLPLHMQRAWRRGRNRLTAIVMLATNCLLIVTSFGLYYASSELLRPWTSNIHIGIGLCLPVLFFVHVLIGRLRS